MRTIPSLNDDVAEAQAVTGLEEKSSLIREASNAMIEREGHRLLALLGGREPEAEATSRRRSEIFRAG